MCDDMEDREVVDGKTWTGGPGTDRQVRAI